MKHASWRAETPRTDPIPDPGSTLESDLRASCYSPDGVAVRLAQLLGLRGVAEGGVDVA